MIFAEVYFDGKHTKHNKYGIKGHIHFSQRSVNSKVRVDINLKNVPIGSHGIHIHEKPVKHLASCDSVCSHFNGSEKIYKKGTKGGTTHGSWFFNTVRHVGDLCNNISAFDDGIVQFSYVDNLISLIPNDPNNIVGRSLVIHEDPDDQGFGRNEESLITGNAGEKIFCGNVQYT